jgi:hypothetical protein
MEALNYFCIIPATFELSIALLSLHLSESLLSFSKLCVFEFHHFHALSIPVVYLRVMALASQ